MKNTELLRNIYNENKAINRNLQRLANIGLIGLLGKVAKESSTRDDKYEKSIAKVGLFLVGLSEILLMVGDIIDYRNSNVEEELE